MDANPSPGVQLAVLARIERIEPQTNGGGLLRYCGPIHVFDGHDYRNRAGLLRAWCGALASTVDLRAIEDRPNRIRGALNARLCRRCFIEPKEAV